MTRSSTTAHAKAQSAETLDTSGESLAARGTAWAACAAVAALVFALACFKLASTDTGNNVGYGAHFLEHGEIVGRDPFLMPENAVEFVNPNWCAQIAMALAYRSGGAAGLISLRIALLAVVFAAAAFVLRSRGVGWLWVAWTWLLMALGSYERFTMRPELFSYAVLACMLALLVRGVSSAGPVIALAALQAAWVNLHSYFLIGPMLTGCALVGAWIAAPLGDDGERDRRRAKWLAIALAAQLVACLANPWFVRGALFPIETLRYLSASGAMGDAAADKTSGPWASISEFRSPFWYAGQSIAWRTIQAYWALLSVASLGILAALAGNRRWRALAGAPLTSVFALALLVLMSMQMRRNIALLALIGAPLAMVEISGLSLFAARASGRRRSFGAWALHLAPIALSIWWISGIASGRFYYVERRVSGTLGIGFNPTMYRRDAVAWLAEQEQRPESERPGPNLYVDFFASSNSLLWLPPRYRLFFDTNTFAYPESVLATGLGLGRGTLKDAQTPQALTALFDGRGIDTVLLQCGADCDELVQRLAADAPSWALVYVDPHAVIFLRRTPKNSGLIDARPNVAASIDPRAWIAGVEGPDLYRAMELGSQAAVLIDLHLPTKAIAILEEACRLAPDYHEAWSNLGRCHGILANDAHLAHRPQAGVVQELNAAIACFVRALDIDPDYAAARANFELAQNALEGRW